MNPEYGGYMAGVNALRRAAQIENIPIPAMVVLPTRRAAAHLLNEATGISRAITPSHDLLLRGAEVWGRARLYGIAILFPVNEAAEIAASKMAQGASF